MPETERQMIDRHIALGVRLVAEQELRMVGMRARGESIAGADQLLRLLVESLRLHVEHLERYRSSND